MKKPLPRLNLLRKLAHAVCAVLLIVGVTAVAAIKDVAWLQGNTLASGDNNLAVADPTAILWTVVSSVDTSVFDHSFAEPAVLTIQQDGDYLVSFTAPIDLGDGTGSRATSAFEVFVNGEAVPGALGQSTYLRNSGGHTEASGHFAALLTGLSAGDALEVRTYRIAQPNETTVLEMASLFVERVGDDVPTFGGFATGIVSSADLNIPDDQPDRGLAWTATRKDSGFGHTDGSPNIVLEAAGNYLVFVDVPMSSGVARASVATQVILDGLPVPNGLAEQGYIRNSGGHAASSVHWSGMLRGVTPGQTLTVETLLRAVDGEVLVQDGKRASIIVQKLDGEGLFSSASLDGLFDYNLTTPTTIPWDDFAEISDNSAYNRGGGLGDIGIREDGSYLLVYNDNLEGGSARANPKIRVLVNGTPVPGAEVKSHYIRQTNGHFASSGSLVFLLDGLSAGDTVSLTSERESSGGSVFGPIGDASALLSLIQKETFVPTGGGAEARLTRFEGDVQGFVVELLDQGSPVATDSVAVSVNGSDVEAAVSKADTVTTVRVDFARLPDNGTSVEVAVAYRVESGEAFETELVYTVTEVFARLTSQFRVEGVNRNQAGFQVRVTQLTDEEGNQVHGNSSAGAEQQLAGLHPQTGEPYVNEASPETAEVETVINWDQAGFDPGGDNFDFNNGYQDEFIPGIPGTFGSDNGVVAEIVTFLELDAGLHTLGVNSDDGFVLSFGRTPTDRLAVTAGIFEGGRGSADSIFNIVADEAGFYPMRLLWWEGNGGANIEFFSVEGGDKVLINDSTHSQAIKAYRSGPSLPSITRFEFPDRTVGSTLDFAIADGAVGVQEGSVSLSLNGQPVEATVSRDGAETLVNFDNGDLFPGGDYTGALRFIEASTPPFERVAEFGFRIPVGIVEVLRDRPVAYWGLGESGGNVAFEEVNDSLEGQYQSLNNGGLPELGVERLAVGAPTTAARFSAANQTLVKLPDHDAIDNLAIEDRTIELWFKASSLPTSNIGIEGQPFTDRSVLWDQGGANRGITVYLLGTQASNPTQADLVFFSFNNASSIWNEPDDNTGTLSPDVQFVRTSIDADTVYHVAFVMDGDPDGLNGTITGYVNGETVGSHGGVGIINAGHNAGGFGALNANGAFPEGKINGTFAPGHPSEAYYFDGIMDEVAVFDRALSADRIRAHYESGLDEVPLFGGGGPGGAVGAFADITLSDGQVTLTWDGDGTLQSSVSVSGPYQDVVGAVSPHSETVASGENRFYRLMGR